MNTILSEKDPELVIVAGFASRISDAIWLMWGYPECDIYLNKLMFDSRDGNRKGFPPEVALAIMILYNRHQATFKFGLTDVWAMNETRKLKG